MERTKSLIPYILYGLTASWFVFLSPYGLSYTDEGFLLESTSRLLSGQRPISDFYCSYFPGRYYLTALIERIFGQDLLLLRMALNLLFSFVPVLIWHTARRLTGPYWALLPAVWYLFLPGVYYNRFYGLGVVLCLVTTIRFFEHSNSGSAFLAGFVHGLVLLFRQDVGLTGVCSFLFLFALSSVLISIGKTFDARKAVQNLGVYGVSFLVPLMPFFYLFISDRDFREGLSITLDFAARAYHEKWLLPYPSFYGPLFSGELFSMAWSEIVYRGIFHLPFYAIVAFVFIFVIEVYKSSSYPYNKSVRIFRRWNMSVLLLLWSVASLYYSSLRTSMNHLLLSAIPWTILGTLLIHQVHHHSSLRHRTVSRCLFDGVTLSIFIVILCFACFHGDYLTGSPGILFERNTALVNERLNVYIDQGRATQLQNISAFVRLKTVAETPFIALPCFSIIPVVCERNNFSYFLWLTPDVVTPEIEQRFITEIEQNKPPYIAFMDLPIDQMKSRQPSIYSPHIKSYLDSHYVSIREFYAADWELAISMLRREPGPLYYSLATTLQQPQPQQVQIQGQVRVQNRDFGFGRQDFLSLTHGSFLVVTYQLPAGRFLIRFSKPLYYNERILPDNHPVLEFSLKQYACPEDYWKDVWQWRDEILPQNSVTTVEQVFESRNSSEIQITIGFDSDAPEEEINPKLKSAIGTPRIILMEQHPMIDTASVTW